MFDSLLSDRLGGASGNFRESYEGPSGGGGGDTGAFGDIASYQVCACCARFHGAASSGDDGGQGVILNSDDRGGFGTNGKPSLGPIDAGAQITRTGNSWAANLGQAATVTFAFRLSAATMPTDTAGFTQFSAQQITATLNAMAAWSDVAGITFNRVTDAGSEYSNSATMLLGNYSSGQDGAAAFAYLPGARPGQTSTTANAGDVWINSSLSYNATPVQHGYGQQTLLHEIGHAIGLSHPAAYNASAGQSITYSQHAIYFEDSRQYTVMSYFSESNTGGSFSGGYSSAPLMDDIAAAQRLYGANMATRTGDTVYGFNSTADRLWYAPNPNTSRMIFCVWDAGGTDTLDFSGYSQNGVIDLRQGAFSSVGGLLGNVSIAIGAVIENAVGGTGADAIRGNSAANVIRGGGGNDTIDGGLGSDTVVFSGPLSSYTISWNGQVGTVVGGGATVTITNVEFLQFSDQAVAAAPTGGLLVAGDITNETIEGTALADTIGGLGGDDTINGLAGADNLNGGSGVDNLNGGEGDDVLTGGLGDDILTGGAGIDTADYSGAGAGVTARLDTGMATGGAGDDTLSQMENLTGSAHADTLTGDDGANVLRGNGGIDTMNGQGGADTMYAGAPGQGGGAPDVVKSIGTANSSIGTAVSLNGAFDLMENANIASSTTIPHATVRGVSHGGLEYYAVTVAAGDAVTFDIDAASFDTTLRLFNSGGTELANNDDADTADGGNATDSHLTYTFATAGTYYIQVGQWVSNSGGTFTTGPSAAGSTYTLHVSVPSAPAVPIVLQGSTMNGDGGDDVLNGGSGIDVLNGGNENDTLNGGGGDDTVNGGNGTDTAVFAGARSVYTLSTSGGVTTVTGPDGTDSLTNVERLQFSDGLFNIDGTPISGAISGTENADSLNGTANADTINALGGDDTINGGAGNDTIDGGAGTDTAVFGGAIAGSTVSTSGGVTTVTGPDGTDSLTNVERLRFSDGTLIVGAGGGQYFEGTPNADTLNGTAFNDQMFGGEGGDTLNGAAGDDQIQGGGGNDVVNGGAGVDAILGQDGDDALVVTSVTTTPGQNRSTFDGGAGTDTFDASAVGDNLEFTATAGQFTVANHAVTGVERVLSGSGADGLDFRGFTTGLEIDGGAGNDIIFAGDGADVVRGGLGDDQITLFAGDQGYGDDGNDIFDVFSWSTTETITMSGGAGTDLVRIQASDLYRDITIDLAAGTGLAGSNPLALFGVENVLLLAQNSEFGTQTVRGDGAANSLGVMSFGSGFAATLDGRGGDDTLVGDQGADTLIGGSGNDTLNGGANIDLAVFTGNRSAYTISTTAGVTTITGPDGTDTLTNIERLQFADGLYSITGAPILNDINGTPNADTLNGTAGGDNIVAGDGDDTVTGAGGNDTIDGGGGTDTAVFGGAIAGSTVSTSGGVTTVTGPDGTDTLTNVERLRFSDGTLIVGAGGGQYFAGTPNADSINGTAFNDQIEAGANADTIDAGAGADQIDAGEGDDLITGGAGNDAVNGGAGTDTAVFAAGGVSYTVTSSGGTVTVTSTDGTDTLTNVERLRFGGVELAVSALTGTTLIGANTGETLNGAGTNDLVYGLGGADTLNGGDGDDILAGGAGADALNGGNGTDTASYASAAAGVTARLDVGSASNDGDGGTDTFNSIENLTGSAFNDTLFGNSSANVLRGGEGRDTILGLGGNDVIHGGAGVANELYGGQGDDTYVVENRIDTIVEQAGEGYDIVQTSQFQLNLSANVEELVYTGTGTFTGVGNVQNNTIRGGTQRDTLIGGGGDDTLYGGSGAANELYGGAGNDAYVLEAADSIIEGAGEGTDTVITSALAAYNLGANVENLTYTGSGAFTAGGNALDNVLTGAGGNDVLRGRGGADALVGGAGTDTADYSLAAAGVTARLDVGSASNDGDGGTDTFNSIENLTGSAFNDTLFGNSGANELRGGEGRDVLLGLGGDDMIHGGSGVANELYGGAGNDTYVVDNRIDTIVEQAGEGTDTVLTGQFQLNLSAHVENLTYTGSSTFVGVGNAQNNTIRGGAQRDTLIGGGGADILIGGAGAANELYGGEGDDYYILQVADSVIEGAGAGIDTIDARVSGYVLGANIENLIYGASTGNFTGTGNALNNLIMGGAGDDVLRGGGGSDQIQGGAGSDTLVLTGLTADYTITAEGAGWRIVDNVAGRDGSTLATSIETLRFGDGSTQGLGGAPMPLQSEKEAWDDEAFILPALTDDEALVLPSLAGGKDDGAQTLPAADDILVLPVLTGDKALTEAGPQVLPGVMEDDAFVLPALAAKEAGPQVLPGLSDDLFGEGSDGVPDLLPTGLVHRGGDLYETSPDLLDGRPAHDPWS